MNRYKSKKAEKQSGYSIKEIILTSLVLIVSLILSYCLVYYTGPIQDIFWSFVSMFFAVLLSSIITIGFNILYNMNNL